MFKNLVLSRINVDIPINGSEVDTLKRSNMHPLNIDRIDSTHVIY